MQNLSIVSEHIHRSSDFPLDEKSTERLWHMEHHHFWFKVRNLWIRQLLKKLPLPPKAQILEVGCGSGAVTQALCQMGHQVTGVETARPLIQKAAQRCPNARFVLGSVNELPKHLRGPYDAIAFFDVLEHLQDPRELIHQTLLYAKAGTHFLITVPAMEKLFSRVDAASGHKKRYERGELTILLASEGIGQVQEYGLFRWMVPLLKLHRPSKNNGTDPSSLTSQEKQDILNQDSKVPWAPINLFLRNFLSLEVFLRKNKAHQQMGSSLFATGVYHPESFSQVFPSSFS